MIISQTMTDMEEVTIVSIWEVIYELSNDILTFYPGSLEMSKVKVMHMLTANIFGNGDS